MDRTLTGTTMVGQSGPVSNGNEGVLHIPQSSRTGNFLSDSLGQLLSGWSSYPSTEM